MKCHLLKVLFKGHGATFKLKGRSSLLFIKSLRMEILEISSGFSSIKQEIFQREKTSPLRLTHFRLQGAYLRGINLGCNRRRRYILGTRKTLLLT